MIVGIGIDVASIERMKRAIERHGDRFVARLLTDKEREIIAPRLEKAEAVAARFAVKEAAYKALGGPKDVLWHHIEVDRMASGAPAILFHGPAVTRAEELGVKRKFVSITHDAGVAAAVVILEA
jgi:holo-[acyl-carrier protein] synthase